MIASPRIGQRVRLHYREALRAICPHHGKTGTVIVASRGKPRNIGVRLDDGTCVAVPCGNLNKEQQ